MTRGPDPSRSWAALGSARAWLLVWIPILLITLAHYATGSAYHWAHDVFRRLYYIPIVLGAFLFGLRGALSASVLTSIVYAPHAFSSQHHFDPGASTEKLLEMLLYNVMGYITGMLADREHRERMAQETIARQLAESLEELKLMEEQLVRAGKLRALGEMTAGLAHEINNPLASLKGAAEILSDEIRPDSPRRPMIDILTRELDRLSALLGRFMSFARPLPFCITQISLRELIEPVVSLMEAQARKQNVRIEFDPAGADAAIRGDKQQVTSVLMNLLINAIQAMPSGGSVRIRTQRVSRARRQYGVITLQDTGPGVPDELKDKIFNPFVTTKEQGSGLGLAIAARVVDAHDGLIELRDAQGGGAEFTILLPIANGPH
jgi:two-component system, NtrC family, sensor histidine kinase HydH